MKLSPPMSPPLCGHARHVGCCPSCQRAAAARQALQLAQAVSIAAARVQAR